MKRTVGYVSVGFEGEDRVEVIELGEWRSVFAMIALSVVLIDVTGDFPIGAERECELPGAAFGFDVEPLQVSLCGANTSVSVRFFAALTCFTGDFAAAELFDFPEVASFCMCAGL